MTLSPTQIILIEDGLRLLAARWATLDPAARDDASGDAVDAMLAELLTAVEQCADITVSHAPRPYVRMPE
jgi:hypothetical protein